MIKARNGRLKIAVQKNGRLTESTLELLKRAGFDFEFYGDRLFSNCSNFNLDLLFIRDDDIPEYVQDGVCDLGIVGTNMVQERNAEVEIIEPLNFARCRLCLAVPIGSSIFCVEDLEASTIATSYPNILKRFILERGISCDVVEVSGSVEITPALEISDAILDVVSSGTTLSKNGLQILETVLESEALLIGNPKLLDEGRSKNDLDRFLLRLRAVLMARQTKYIMMNAPESALAKIQNILPGLESPTVMPLAEEGMIAIHSVVAEDTFWEDIEQLKEAGASDILVVPIEKIIF